MWFFRKPPASVIENVSVELNKHPSLPGMLEVEIVIRGVVSPHKFKNDLSSLCYGQRGSLEQFLRLALPHVNGLESIKKALDFANKVISANGPKPPPDGLRR